MKGKFQTTMIYAVAAVQSIYIMESADRSDSETEIISFILFIVCFLLFMSFLGEQKPEVKK